MGTSGEGKQYVISGVWDPKDQAFEVLNTETPKGTALGKCTRTDHLH